MGQVTRLDELDDDFLAEAHRLYAAMPADDRSVFNDPAFIRICWHSFERRAPFAYVFRDDPGRLVGAAFFRTDSVSLGGRNYSNALVPLVFKCSDFTPFLVGPRERSAFLNAIARELHDTRRLAFLPRLRQVDFDEFPRSSSRTVFYGTVANPICVDEDGAFDSIIRKKSLRRRTNWFARNGKLETLHQSNHLDRERLDSLFSLHVERWAYQGIESKFSDPTIRQLYLDIALKYPETASPGNEVVLTDVTVDDESVAMHIGFVWNSRFLYQIPTVSLRYLERWPGEVLIRSLFEYAHERAFSCLDLGFGDEGYKQRFSNRQLEYSHLVIAPNLPVSIALNVASADGPLRHLRGIGKSLLSKIGAFRSSWVRLTKSNGPAANLALYVSTDQAVSEQSDVQEFDFGDYVVFCRKTDLPPYPLTTDLFDRFKKGFRLFCLQSGTKFAAFAWFLESSRLSFEDTGSELVCDQDVVWCLDIALPRDGTKRQMPKPIVQSAVNLMSPRRVILALEDDQWEPDALEGFCRVGTVGRRGGSVTFEPDQAIAASGVSVEIRHGGMEDSES